MVEHSTLSGSNGKLCEHCGKVQGCGCDLWVWSRLTFVFGVFVILLFGLVANLSIRIYILEERADFAARTTHRVELVPEGTKMKLANWGTEDERRVSPAITSDDDPTCHNERTAGAAQQMPTGPDAPTVVRPPPDDLPKE